jgi:hypothetical protein
MATQIAFVGGERVGVREPLEEVIRFANRETPIEGGPDLARFTKEDGTVIYVNPDHVLYVRELDV